MSDISDEFPLRDDLVHLNHAAIGPWPARASRAIAAFAEENARQGSADFPRWMREMADLRKNVADLLDAGAADDIALLKNTSEGLSTVAFGLDWRPGDNVVGFRDEFISNRVVWQALDRFGVEVRLAAMPDDDTPLETAVEALCDENTRLVALSSVQYGDGLRLDLERLGRFCRTQNILFCVDAIQSLGALRHSVRELPVDFLVAGTHKWLLSPEGAGIFWVRPDLRDRLKLNQFGWHTVEAAGEFERQDWEIARGARRFECGSPNRTGLVGLAASLSVFREVGYGEVEKGVLDNTGYLAGRLADIPGIRLLSPAGRDRRGGIVTFAFDRRAPKEAWSELNARGIICAPRGGGVRFSPHFYTPRAALDHALEAVEDLARR